MKEKPMYVMKYSNREGSYNHPDNHGRFVGLDRDSGGYPYAVESFGNRVEIWTDLERARIYQNGFKCLDIYELNIGVRILP